MTNIFKLHNEVGLITDLKLQTFGIIRGCEEIQPIKLIVESHDILELSLNILNNYPSIKPGTFVYDEGAMTHLANLTRQLVVFYNDTLPRPEFPRYKKDINKLLRLCNVPTGILVI